MAVDIPGAVPLPAPTSNESLYLAALLDEIRQFRQELAARRPTEPPDGEVELREPESAETPAGPRPRRPKKS